MAYRLLGWVTWKGAKWLVRRKLGAAAVPAPVLAGGAVLAAVGVLLAARRAGGGD
jgi:hypothetical protein